MNVLFVTWDGPQVSYMESLFLPIFSRLASFGINFHILQFSWGDSNIFERRHQLCEEANCSYHIIKVRKKVPIFGNLFALLQGVHYLRKAFRKLDIDAVLPRSTLPALISLIAIRGFSQKLIFDADGLPLDERVDFGGLAANGKIYRFLRDIEASAVRKADLVLTRSNAATNILLARAGAGCSAEKVHVVFNGRDSTLFNSGNAESRARIRQELGIDAGVPLVAYVGSLGPQYCVSEMIALFERIVSRCDESHFLVLTGSPDLMLSVLKNYPQISKLVTVMSVPGNQVAQYLSSADLGLAFREYTFSMQAVAPIKLGEYLLCGVPVVATNGIGDSHFIDEEAGLLVDSNDPETFEAVSDWLFNQVLPRRNDFRNHCRLVGVKHFSLESSVDAYRKALESIQDKL